VDLQVCVTIPFLAIATNRSTCIGLGQGIIGATATGTHGSGLTLPPLASMIVGINLISGQFDPKSGLPIQYRIEPTDGITDPKRAPAGWILQQDDEDFNAAVTAIGAIGVVYSVTITTVPFYYVRETREMVDWPIAKALLEHGPQGDILKYHNAEVWVNPYTYQTLLTRREIETSVPANEAADPSLSMHASLLKELPALHTVLDRIFPNGFSDITDEIAKVLGIILALFLRHFPLLVPSVSGVTSQRYWHFPDEFLSPCRSSTWLCKPKITRSPELENITRYMTSVRSRTYFAYVD
jgi:hypothetical protein